MRLLAQPVANPSAIVHLTSLRSATRIQLHSPLQQIENDPPLKPQTHQLRKNLRGKTKQVRVQGQDHQPLLNPLLKHSLQLQVPVGKRVQFFCLLNLFHLHLHVHLHLQTGSLGAAVSFRFSPPPSPPGSQAFGGFLFAQITAESDFPLLHISF